ncbi:MAG: TIGR02281 family clan AA aspartic protease [Pseudomonadota bacterium]
MSPDDYANLLYLGLFLAVLLGSYLIYDNKKLSETARAAAVWFMIFLGAVLAYGQWETVQSLLYPSRSVVMDDGRIELRRQMDGHFHADLIVNGENIDFLIDTGATSIVLNKEDAARVGLDVENLRFGSQASTANGIVRTSRVILDSIVLGGFEDRRVRAFVNEGELQDSLLGMTYLERFSEITIAGDRLILRR